MTTATVRARIGARVLHVGPFAACVECGNGGWTYAGAEPLCRVCHGARLRPDSSPLRRWTRAEKDAWWDAEWARVAAVGRTLPEEKRVDEWWQREIRCPPWDFGGRRNGSTHAEVLHGEVGAESSAS